MGESLTQPCRVQEEGFLSRKLLLIGKNKPYVYGDDGTYRISTG